MSTTDDLFGLPEVDPGLEFVLANGRTYRLNPFKVDGKICTVVSWTEPGGRRGVIGGFHRDDAAALLAIEEVEARRESPMVAA